MSTPAHEPPTSTEVPGLVRALRVLRERWWVILLCPIVTLAVALVYLQRQPKEYTATAKLQFVSNSLPSQVAGVGGEQLIDPEGVKATNVQLVTTPPVAALVVKSLKLTLTPGELLEDVSASNPQNDYIVDVTATNGDPHLAAAIANSFAEQYVVYSEAQNVGQLVKGEQLITRKTEELPPSDTVDRANLRGLYQKLLLLQSVQTGNAHVVSTAGIPGSPSSPKKKSTALIALVAGLLLGVGIAFVLNLLDRRVKSWEEFEELYQAPALAAIPTLPRKAQSAKELEITLEPFRILNNSLPLLPHLHPIKTVIVTSAIAGEGKTSVALGLARAAADAERRVILVEADLRRPMLEHRLDRNRSEHGLTSALLDERDPIECLRTPIRGLEDSFKLLPSGPTALNVPNLMSSERLAEIFETLSSNADLVVIDSAPLLPVADTRVLLDGIDVDACLVVARAGLTTRDQARRARLVFERRKMKAVGLVVNDLSEVSDGYDYYGPVESDIVDTSPAAGGSLRNTARTSPTVSTRSISKPGK